MHLSLELLPMPLVRGTVASASMRALSHLPRGTLVYLPHLPADPPEAIELAIAHLRTSAPHLKPVPHIAVRRLPSEAELVRRLDAWQSVSSNGVSEVLIVRGDTGAAHDFGKKAESAGPPLSPNDNPAGPFGTSLDLLESGILARQGINSVGLCGHPEGIGTAMGIDEALCFLCRKLDYAARSGLQAHVVTQVCFDAATTTAYVDGLRGAGYKNHVSLGLVGPTKPEVLQRMATQCGVKPPRRLGSHQPSSQGETIEVEESIPNHYLSHLATWQAARGTEKGAQAIHVYPFGGVKRTFEWLHRYRSTTKAVPLSLQIGATHPPLLNEGSDRSVE